MDGKSCPFCQEQFSTKEEANELTSKGCESIQKACQERGSNITVHPGQLVHVKCRQKFINPKSIACAKRKSLDGCEEERKKVKLRSEESNFNFKDHCLFCACGDIYNGKKQESKLIPVRSFDFQKKIIDSCDRFPGKWAEEVKGRVIYAQDLPAADAVYHNICSVNFRTGKQVPIMFQNTTVKQPGPKYQKHPGGRPRNTHKADAFKAVTEFLTANDDEQVTIADLIEKMKESLTGTDIEPYSFPHMKQELLNYFGDRIIITEINGKQNVVTFQTTASKILHEFHQKSTTNLIDEKKSIIQTAGRLIKQDIKNIVQNRDFYPTVEDINENCAFEYLPESLQELLTAVVCRKDSKLIIASIGQSIIQAARPHVLLAPLQVGLGVQMHHLFQSRFLIDSLNHHGFSCSYSEVKRFERSASVSSADEVIPIQRPETCLQFAADNVDHNSITLDGKGTFHGMGMIAMVTPGTKHIKSVPRVKVSSKDIERVGKVNIKHFMSDAEGAESFTYKEVKNPNVSEPFTNIDLLWKSSLLLKVKSPQWSGFMQLVHKGNHPGTSSIQFLPIIDMDPNDLSCIYSTLKYVTHQARQHNTLPVVTFDQPLWLKAFKMVETTPELQQCVVRLGGFHTEISFLGSIGHLMKGTGLEQLLEVIYAPNTVSHMLNGKAVSRAVRGHILVDAALNAIIASRALDPHLPELHDRSTSADVAGPSSNVINQQPISPDNSSLDTSAKQSLLSSLEDIMEAVMRGSVTATDLETNDILQQVNEKFEAEKQILSDFRLARLWIQYDDMVDILRKFLKAERLGNWPLSLQSLHEMLPYLAASGHNLYVKCSSLYLQKMENLEVEFPEVYNHFMKGLHVVRRSDRLWAGISTDLTIEQCLMRSLKMRGGLTRGRGMTEIQRLIWVLSAPCCADINDAMQNFTKVSYSTSEQHKEATASRINRDMHDVQELLRYLTERNPLDTEGPQELRNIATGVTALSGVNCDTAKDVGAKILHKMTNAKVTEFSFKKKDQAVTMEAKKSVKIRDEEVVFDPLLLFQRLVIAGTRCDELPEVFTHELCAYPAALFESKHMMLEANKAVLADALFSKPIEDGAPQPDAPTYVLDGGALIHKIPWTKGSTWDDILQSYAKHVATKYGKATVVFDGYDGSPSTKDCTHMRRTGGCIGSEVYFDETMKLQTKKDEFLANSRNKQRLINLLANTLRSAGCTVHHAKGDADLLIVTKAIEGAEIRDTVVVADDTDILVLLVHHAQNTTCNVWFKPSTKKESKKPSKFCNITALRSHLGSVICEYILFAHAVLGCDTTSRVFGIGKGKSVNKLKSDLNFVEQAKVFMSPSSSQSDIIVAGHRALVCLYNGHPNGSLNQLRLMKFLDKSTTSTKVVEPQTIPPTEDSAKYHSLRVFQQIQVWLGNDEKVPPCQWGWKVNDGKMIPLMTDKPPAPIRFLEAIHCKCKTGCNTLRCSCRKNGLECSAACSECRGGCGNSSIYEYDATDSEDDD